MPIIDILGGVTGGDSGSGSSGSSNTTPSTLSTLANTVFPGAGSILQSILGFLSCIGGSAFDQNQYNIRKQSCESFLNTIANNPNDIPQVQWMVNQLRYLEDVNRFDDLPKLSNSCSKQWCQKIIDLTVATKTQIVDRYNYNGASVRNINGKNVLVENITSYKGDLPTPPVTYPPVTNPPVTYPPTTPPVTTTPTTYPPVTYPPTDPPVTYPPVTYPDTTTPPVYYPPVTYPDTTGYPPVTNTGTSGSSSNGLTRTQTTHPDGSITIYLWNPDGTLYKTTNIPAPSGGGGSMTSSLDGNIDINGNVGDWNFGLNNNKDQTLYIAGGLGLLGLIAYMVKSKK